MRTFLRFVQKYMLMRFINCMIDITRCPLTLILTKTQIIFILLKLFILLKHIHYLVWFVSKNSLFAWSYMYKSSFLSEILQCNVCKSLSGITSGMDSRAAKYRDWKTIRWNSSLQLVPAFPRNNIIKRH